MYKTWLTLRTDKLLCLGAMWVAYKPGGLISAPSGAAIVYDIIDQMFSLYAEFHAPFLLQQKYCEILVQKYMYAEQPTTISLYIIMTAGIFRAYKVRQHVRKIATMCTWISECIFLLRYKRFLWGWDRMEYRKKSLRNRGQLFQHTFVPT